MISEFIRLRPAPGGDTGDEHQRLFLCELPDPDDDDAGKWLDCGLVNVIADASGITAIRAELNDVFVTACHDDPCAPEDIVRVVALWAVWESGWPLGTEVHVHLSQPRALLRFLYHPVQDRLAVVDRAG